MKKAFTLAETLLVLLIIGVLIGLCLGAGRNSLQNAYNLYYYQAVNTINIAFNDFLYLGSHRTEIPNPAGGPSTYTGVGNPCQALLDHIELMRSDNLNIKYACDESNEFYSSIKITVPKVKTFKDNSSEDNFYVAFSTGYQHIPDAATGSYISNNITPELIILPKQISTEDNGRDDLLIDNHYILPTYVDDGKIGREQYDTNGNFTYEPIVPMSYRWSYCATVDESASNTLYGALKEVIPPIMCPDGLEDSLGFEMNAASGRFKGKPIKFLKPNILR